VTSRPEPGARASQGHRADGTPESATGRFWSQFAARHYRRESVAIDDPPSAVVVNPEEMFALLLRSCAYRGEGPKDPLVKFYVDQRQVVADLDDYLPAQADGSLDGYLQRLERQLGGLPYLLTVQRMHAASRWLWKQAAEFLAGLYEACGSLPYGAEVEAFVGRYPNTVSGIHRERSGVFVFMVQGSKDFLVWPPQTQDLPCWTARYEHARPAALRLTCEPGRLVYWPAMHWHVGESPAAPSAGLHVAVLEESPGLTALVSAAAGDIEAAVGVGEPYTWPASPSELGVPPQYEGIAQALINSCGEASTVRDRLTAEWLRRRTGLGFAAPPPRYAEPSLQPDQAVVRDSVYPIVLVARDAVTSWCAADGRVGYARSAPALSQLIDVLNTGSPVSVRAALALATSEIDRELLDQTMRMLAGWRALKLTG
jgi:50S ribosomal protein L16 3-hydroxylase